MHDLLRTLAAAWPALMLAACGDPVQRFSVKIVDEEGRPRPDVECKAWFKRAGDQMSYKDYFVTGRTGADGKVELEGETIWAPTQVEARAQGCYLSIASNHWALKQNGNRWEPWPVEVALVMREIRKPHPMHALKPGDGMRFDFPGGLSGPVGFDLVERDWVAPHGRGRVADLMLTARRSDPKETGHFPAGHMVIEFPQPGNGIIDASSQAAGGSLLVSPHEAPEGGYQERVTLSNRSLEDGLFPGLELRRRVWVMRIRTELDASGRLVSALYGKIQGHPEILFFTRGPAFRMTYYLNAEPNERNLEWDMKTNLFADLPRERWPQQP